VIAPLLLFRYGDGRSLPLLRSIITKKGDQHDWKTERAAAAVYASFGQTHLDRVKNVASQVEENKLSQLVLLTERIRSFDDVPKGYKQRRVVKKDFVGQSYVDTRSLLAIRLLRFSDSNRVKGWLKQSKQKLLGNKALSKFDLEFIERMYP
jgi:hypothetical protein